MGTFKDRINYKPHNFNTLTVTLNGDTVVTGLNSFAAERNEDEISVAIAADGVGLFQENPNVSGTITMEIIEADATNAAIWDLWKAGEPFAITATDSRNERFNCAMAGGRVKKPPVLNKGLEVNYIEWVFEAVYLDVDSGGYALESA
jgi:hypothetical protein